MTVQQTLNRGLQTYLSDFDLTLLGNTRIGIAGAGGLGSNTAMMLVRSGIKRLVLADFDRIEASNLNRQFYFMDQTGRFKVECLQDNLKRIASDLDLQIHRDKILPGHAEELFSRCDLVIEAFDRAEYKQMLIQELVPLGKMVISASGLAGYGKSDAIRISRPKQNWYLVGDRQSEAGGVLPPLAPRVMIAAAKQADIALHYILTQGGDYEF